MAIQRYASMRGLMGDGQVTGHPGKLNQAIGVRIEGDAFLNKADWETFKKDVDDLIAEEESK